MLTVHSNHFLTNLENQIEDTELVPMNLSIFGESRFYMTNRPISILIGSFESGAT